MIWLNVWNILKENDRDTEKYSDSYIHIPMTTQCYTDALADHPISDPQSHSVMETEKRKTTQGS